MEKRCETCRWWVEIPKEPVKHGECQFPLPFWVNKFYPYASAGKDCPTWEARDE